MVGPTPAPYDTRFPNVPDPLNAFASAVSAQDDMVGDILDALAEQGSASRGTHGLEKGERGRLKATFAMNNGRSGRHTQ